MPLRAHNNLTYIGGKKPKDVFYPAKFTIPDDKQLIIELNEKRGWPSSIFFSWERRPRSCQSYQRIENEVRWNGYLLY